MIAHVKKLDTGEIRQHDVGDIPLGLVEFVFSEGNYSCDCNRSLFFDGHEVECCSDNKYLVNVEHDGQIVYKEFEC